MFNVLEVLVVSFLREQDDNAINAYPHKRNFFILMVYGGRIKVLASTAIKLLFGRQEILRETVSL